MQARRTSLRPIVPAQRWLSGALFLVVACGDAAGDGDTDGSSGDGSADGSSADGSESGDGDAGVGDPSVKVGEFGVQLVAPVAASGTTEAIPGFTSLLGKVYDGPVPAAIVWEEKASAGDCRLLVPRVPFCEKPCGAGVCVEDDVCQDNPTPKAVGTLTVTGLVDASGKDEFSVEPIANGYVTPVDVDLPYPPCDEGAEVVVSASGGDYAAFSLAGKGIAPLVLPEDASYEIKAGQPFAIAWTKAGAGAASRVQVKLDISHHGGTKGKIECDVADTGSLEIDASLVDQLTALGVAGFPTFVLTRSSVSSTTIAPGRVDLKLYTYAERAVVVDGLTSCTGDEQCPEGQTCQSDLTCK